MDAARRDGLLRHSDGERRRREREDLLEGADHLDEAALDDELAARRAIVGPEARDLRRPFVELGAEGCPDRSADALPAEPRVDR